MAVITFALAALLTATAPAAAHHWFTAAFEPATSFSLTGTVSRFEWRNPHVVFYLDVADTKTGAVTTWLMEMGSPNSLDQTGWSRDSLAIGERVVVEGSPAKDGSPVGYPHAITLASTGRRLVPAQAASDPNNVTGSSGLILIDKRGNHVRFLDPTTYRERSSFQTGPGAPHDLAISPDRTTAYIPIYGDGIYRRNPNPGQSILIVDLASQQVTGTIDISPYEAPHGIQVDANGTLYVVCDISRKLLIIDPKTRRIDAAIDVEGTGHWVALLPDASKAYVANQSGADFISVVDLKARRMIGRVPATGGARGIIASGDGARVYAMQIAEQTMLVIDPVTDAVVDRVRLQGHTQSGYKLRLSPDGRTLITCGTGGGSETYINLLRTSDLHGAQVVLKAGINSMGFAFAPDGRTALVANDGDGTVTVVDVEAGRVTSTFKAGAGIESLSYY